MSGIAWIPRPSPVEPPTSVRAIPTPTIEAPAPPSVRAVGPAAAPAAARTPRPAANVVQALRSDDVFRLRHFTQWVIALCAISLVVQHFNGNPSPMKTLMRVGLVVLAATATWVWNAARQTNDYDTLRPKMRIFGVVATVTSFIFELRIGVFSPVPVVVVFGMSYFARSEAKRFVWGLALLAIAAYTTSATLIALEVVPDPGLFSAVGLEPSIKVFAIVSTTSIFTATLLQARMSRRSSEAMLQAVRNATLEAQRREAQLAEANGDLARALRATVGREGRYTGTTAGHWSIGEVVGRGAMGEVYAATDARSRARVAVKILHPNRAAMEEDPRPRFMREARIATSLRSPHLVEVHGIGETADGTPFIAMELLVGRDLATVLRRSSRLALPDVLTMVNELAEGISIAHDAGVVHRDLKPQNLFYCEDGEKARWKVLDFGISTLVDSNGTLTAEAIIGTPGYMAPEQANGERVDNRTDIFALGAVVYRALTGQPAFPGTAAPQILFSVVFENPVRPRALEAMLPPDIEAVLAIALAKSPADRFSSAREFARALILAASNDLEPSLRQRAYEILAKHPWKSVSTRPPL